MRLLLRYALPVALIVGLGLYLLNASWLAPVPSGPAVLLAHRGVHQTVPPEGLTGDTCTASRIHPPSHGFIENTLPSMQAAFAAGADIVELDIHPTTDGQFVVLHDWTLDCRTNGTGVTRQHTLAEIKALDAGHGYTADGGRTFPFRGQGVGLIPSLDEVLARFPGQRFLIHIKSNDAAEGRALAERLARFDAAALGRIMVYGGNAPVEEVERRLPALRTGSRRTLKDCLVGYIVMGWLGHVPSACRGELMLVPINIAPWLWGWPNRFLARLRAADVALFVLGPYDGGQFSTGIDDAATLARLPPGFAGGIWTNRIETIAPLIRRAELGNNQWTR